MSDEATTETTDQGAASARIRQLVARDKELESRVVELEPVAAQAEKWRNQVDEVKAASKAEHEWLLACLLGGKPTASTDFQKQLESSHGVRLLRRPVGRPRRLPPAGA